MKNHPIKAQSPEQPGSVILSKEPSHEVFCSLSLNCLKLNNVFPSLNLSSRFCLVFGQVDFSRHIGSLSKAQAKKVARFLPNPEKHWGPKLRAGRQITSKHVSLIGHEAVNGHLNQHPEELKEDEEAEQEDNVQVEVDPKRQKTTTENMSSTS